MTDKFKLNAIRYTNPETPDKFVTINNDGNFFAQTLTDENALAVVNALNFHEQLIDELKAIGHNIYVGTQQFNRIQILLEKATGGNL